MALANEVIDNIPNGIDSNKPSKAGLTWSFLLGHDARDRFREQPESLRFGDWDWFRNMRALVAQRDPGQIHRFSDLSYRPIELWLAHTTAIGIVNDFLYAPRSYNPDLALDLTRIYADEQVAKGRFALAANLYTSDPLFKHARVDEAEDFFLNLYQKSSEENDQRGAVIIAGSYLEALSKFRPLVSKTQTIPPGLSNEEIEAIPWEIEIRPARGSHLIPDWEKLETEAYKNYLQGLLAKGKTKTDPQFYSEVMSNMVAMNFRMDEFQLEKNMPLVRTFAKFASTLYKTRTWEEEQETPWLKTYDKPLSPYLRQDFALIRILKSLANSPARLLNPHSVLGNVIPDILDNRKYSNPAEVVTVENPAPVLIDKIIPADVRQYLTEITDNWEIGQSQGMVIIVGSEKSHTRHPHLFEIKKIEEGIRLLFVDPEDTVGKRSKYHIRPEIVNLDAAIIEPKSGEVIKIVSLRYQSGRYDHKTQLQLASQYTVAETLLENEGLLEMLTGNEQDILYRLVLKPNQATLQARHATRAQMERFLRNGQGWIPLEGKIISLIAIFDRFAKIPDSLKEEQAKYSKVVNH